VHREHSRDALTLPGNSAYEMLKRQGRGRETGTGTDRDRQSERERDSQGQRDVLNMQFCIRNVGCPFAFTSSHKLSALCAQDS
jgi:hypothetical protein